MGEKGNGLAADDTGTDAEGARAVRTGGISGSVAEDPGTGAQGEASVVNWSRSNIKNNMEEPVGGGTGTTGTNPATPGPGSNKPPTPEAGTYSTTKDNAKDRPNTVRANTSGNTGTTGSTPRGRRGSPTAKSGASDVKGIDDIVRKKGK